MPTAYNPEEIARAKHLVALADAINTKINTVSARTSRPVSLACRFGDGFKQLDIAASALSIPFKSLTAVLRIASGDEDIVPTITLSNSVTASTPTYSNGAFETTLTLPSASVTSFSMTIALPQTENFSAWQKTFTVDTTADKAARNMTVALRHYTNGTSSYTETPIDLSAASYDFPYADCRQDSSVLYFTVIFTAPTDDTAKLFVSDLASDAGSAAFRYNQLIYFLPAEAGCQVHVQLPTHTTTQTITFKATLSATDSYTAWSKSFIFNITGGE